MVCKADMGVHWMMTAQNLRRQAGDLTLTVSERTEKIADAMQNLLRLRDESVDIEGKIDELFVEYFGVLSELSRKDAL